MWYRFWSLLQPISTLNWMTSPLAYDVLASIVRTRFSIYIAKIQSILSEKKLNAQMSCRYCIALEICLWFLVVYVSTVSVNPSHPGIVTITSMSGHRCHPPQRRSVIMRTLGADSNGVIRPWLVGWAVYKAVRSGPVPGPISMRCTPDRSVLFSEILFQSSSSKSPTNLSTLARGQHQPPGICCTLTMRPSASEICYWCYAGRVVTARMGRKRMLSGHKPSARNATRSKHLRLDIPPAHNPPGTQCHPHGICECSLL